MVYRSAIQTTKPIFWDMLKQIREAYQGSWLVILIVLWGRMKSKRPFANYSHEGFQNVIDDTGMIDLGFQGYYFTWNNRRAGESNIQERRDR